MTTETAPYWTNHKSTLYHADARALPLADGSVHCAITSPPYWNLRDYGLGQWHGGDADCAHERRAKDRQKAHGLTDRLPDTAAYGGDALEAWPNNTCGHCGAVQESAGIGTEATLAEHIANIVAVFRELRRVLRDDGTCWLNYGDAYAGSWGNYHPTGSGGQRAKETERWDRPAYEDTGRRPAASVPSATGLPPKNLMGLPWRVAFALQDDGWVLRSAIVWHKPNPMPESVSDRPTNAYENVFLLAKSNTATYWTHRDQRGTRQRPGADYRWVDAATDIEYSVKPDDVSGEIIECPACEGKGEIVLQHGQVSLFDGVPEMVELCSKCHTECKKCDDPHVGYLHRWKRINLWRSHDYYYDAEAIREATKPYGGEQPGSAKGKQAKALAEGRSEAHSGKGMMSPDYTRPTSANARNVWSIPTQGFSAASLGIKHLQHPSPDGLCDGKVRIPSEDCPTHGGQAVQVPTGQCGEQTTALRSHHNPDTRDCHGQGQLDDCAPADQHHADSIDGQSLDSQRPHCSHVAIDHSIEIHKTGHALATNPACTPCGESASGIDGKPIQPSYSCQHHDTSENNIAADCGGDGKAKEHAQIEAGRNDKCICAYTNCTRKTDHFATFPDELPRRCILAGTSERGVCEQCGAPWERDRLNVR